MRKMFLGMLFVVMVCSAVFAAESGNVTVDLSENGTNLPEAKIEMPTGSSSPASMKDYVSGELTIRGEKEQEQQLEAPVAAPEPESIYLPQETTSYMRIPMKIADTPGSVQVITSQLIEDQDDFRLKDALRNVAGVTAKKNESFAYEYESNYIRGFTQQLYRDGTLTWGTNNIDMSTVERVEVIKGPASITYGLSEPGGIINVVSKRAEFTPLNAKVRTVVGTNNDYREYLDMGGSVNKNETVAFRLNMSYVNKESFRDYVNSESFTVMPALAWKITDTTRFDLKTTYTHEKRRLDPGLYVDPNGVLQASNDTFLGEPGLGYNTLDDVFSEAILTNEFLDWLTMKTKVTNHIFNNALSSVRTKNLLADGYVTRYFDNGNCFLNETVASNELTAVFDTHCFNNTALFGVEGRYRHYAWNKSRDESHVYNINSVEPVFGHGTVWAPDQGTQTQNLWWMSPYLQDKLVLFDDLIHITLGGRIDNVWQADTTIADIETKSFDCALTGNAGVLVKLLPYLRPYATVSNSFKPQRVSAIDASGNTIDPETGFQVEGGFKSGFFEDKLLFTAAAYQITKKNVAKRDPNDNDYYINSGKLRSQGFEFTLQGEVYKGWDITANYAYTDTDYMETTAAREGQRFEYIPVNSGSVWVTHRHEDGFLKGLRYGCGAYFVGERLGDRAGTYYLPGYITGDLMAGYKRQVAKHFGFNVQMNIHNLWNQDYIESGSGTTVMPGAPFGGTLSVGLEF